MQKRRCIHDFREAVYVALIASFPFLSHFSALNIQVVEGKAGERVHAAFLLPLWQGLNSTSCEPLPEHSC